MSKLLAVLVILITFGMSASSYGVSLIYKVSISVKGVDDNSSLPKSSSLKGFLLLNYTDDGETLTFEDANFVMYGRNAVKSKVYVELDYTGNGLLDLGLWSQGNDYKFINLLCYYDTPFNFEGLMFGKQKPVDIGGNIILDTCVSKYKGAFWVYSGMLLDPEFNIAGTGSISATLWTTFTRKVNDNISYTKDSILAEIKATTLVGYTNITP